ncbi:MAG: glycosyltransferase 87 family protein [Lachnospira sp.]
MKTKIDYKCVSKKNIVFFVTCLIGFIISIIKLVSSRGACLDGIVFNMGDDFFMDFFNHVGYVEDRENVYFVNYNACFPSFAYIFYYLVNRMLPQGTVTLFACDKTTPYGLLTFVVYNMVLTFLLIVGINSTVEKNGKKSQLGYGITLAVLCSNIFIIDVVERGNAVFIALVLLLLSLWLDQCENKLAKEMSLILIAMAAGFKIYPAVFGLIYIKRKDIKRVVRLIIYGVAVMFVPYIFFGGITGLKQNVANLIQLSSDEYESINGVYVAVKTLLNSGMGLDMSTAKLMGNIFMIIIFLMLVAVFFITKKKWVSLFSLVSIMVLIPKWSGPYTCCYFVIPLVYFIMEEKDGIISAIISLFFGMIFSFRMWGNSYEIGNYVMNMAKDFRYICIYALVLTVCVWQIGVTIAKKGNANLQKY